MVEHCKAPRRIHKPPRNKAIRNRHNFAQCLQPIINRAQNAETRCPKRLRSKVNGMVLNSTVKHKQILTATVLQKQKRKA